MKGFHHTLLFTLVISTSQADVWQRGDYNGDGQEDTAFLDLSQGVLYEAQPSAADDHDRWIPILSLPHPPDPPQTAVVVIDRRSAPDALALTNYAGNRLVLAEGQRDGSFVLSEFPVGGPMGIASTNTTLVTLSTAGAEGNELVWFDPAQPAQVPTRTTFPNLTLKRGLINSARFIDDGGVFQVIGTGMTPPDTEGDLQGAFHFLVEISGQSIQSTHAFPINHAYSQSAGRAVLDAFPSAVLWSPGETVVAVSLLLPAVQAAREAAVGFPVGDVIVVPDGDAHQLLILSLDGKMAKLFDYTDSALHERQTFTAPAASRFASAWTPDPNTLEFAVTNENGIKTQLLAFEKSAAGYTAKGTQSFVLGNASKTTVVAYTDNPLLNPAAIEIERFATSSWATDAMLSFGQISATAESFGGLASGLGSPVLTTVQPVNPVNGVLGNQFELDSSICHVGPAGFSGEATVTIAPPPGIYTTTTPISFSSGAQTTVIYRTDGGPWTTWTGGLTLTQSATIEFYGQHSSGLLSPMQSAAYEIDQSFQLTDSNDDGLPDAYAAAFGLDPLGDGNADGDPFSDFDELLGGSDPNDPEDTPSQSSLGSTVNFRIDDANLTGLGGRLTLFRLDGSFVADTTVSRLGTAELFVRFSDLDGLGIAMFEVEIASEGSVVQMAAGVVGHGFPMLALGNLSAEQWLEQSKTIIGGFKSMSGMSSETEVIEISPQSTLGVLAFEAWLGEQLPAATTKPRLVPPSSFILPEIDDEVLITFMNGENRVFEMLPIIQQHHERAGSSEQSPEWHRALGILYQNRRASPLLALRRLFFQNEASTSYGSDLDDISLATLLTEKQAIIASDDDGELETLSGTLTRLEGQCLVLTAEDGTTHLLADAHGQPFWPTTAIFPNSSATATGRALGEALHSAEKAFQVITLVVAEPIVGLTTDSDGDGVDDSYEEAFFGTLSFAADDDPDGDGTTLLEAFNASSPPSGIPLLQGPADFDGDGLPDTFELQYFGNLTTGDPDMDDDGDEANNRQEELFGTDPKDSQSSPSQALTATPNPDGTYRITIFTQAGRRYLIEGTNDLMDYETMVPPQDGINNPRSFTTPPTEDTFKAYRVRVISP